MVLEGLHAVEIIRKIVGPTEPRTAPPGTIRGDYAHHSYEYTDKKGIAVKNLIHASGTKKEADEEIKLWFSESDLFDYETVHERHVF
jgi:nucleoside-diphosphate kinase